MFTCIIKFNFGSHNDTYYSIGISNFNFMSDLATIHIIHFNFGSHSDTIVILFTFNPDPTTIHIIQ